MNLESLQATSCCSRSKNKLIVKCHRVGDSELYARFDVDLYPREGCSKRWKSFLGLQYLKNGGVDGRAKRDEICDDEIWGGKCNNGICWGGEVWLGFSNNFLIGMSWTFKKLGESFPHSAIQPAPLSHISSAIIFMHRFKHSKHSISVSSNFNFRFLCYRSASIAFGRNSTAHQI